jgi:hypothetical protein
MRPKKGALRHTLSPLGKGGETRSKMTTASFAFLRKRLLDAETRLAELEEQVAIMSEIISRMADKCLPGLDPAAIDKELFVVNQTKRGLHQ